MHINFIINNTLIETVITFNLLGITIAIYSYIYINWKQHVKNILGKLRRFSYALRQLKKTINKITVTTAYYTEAHAWLSYIVLIWGKSTGALRLFTLQNKYKEYW